MKKILALAALVAWIALIYIVVNAIYGSNKLPERIPTHFAFDGKVNGWGTPQSLWSLPAVGAALALLHTIVSRYPGAFNYPVRVTRENQARLEELALEMIAWLRLEVICLFAWIEWLAIETARSGKQTLAPWGFSVALLVVFGTIAAYVAAMLKAR